MSAPSQTPPGDRELRILIADDDPIVRSAIRALLTDQPDLVVEGEAADGLQAVDLAVALRPDVVLLDEGIVGLDAVTVIARIRAAAPEVDVVVFAAVEDADRGVAGLRSGAAGFLLKEMSSEALLRALRGLAHGEAPLSRALTLRVVQQLQRTDEPEPDQPDARPVWSRLALDEWQVLELLRRGSSARETAATLEIPIEELDARIGAILRKLEVATLDEAISAAERLLAGEPWPSAGAALDEVTRRRLDRQHRPED